MYYIIYLTERCNLRCQYCETPQVRSRRRQDIGYDLETLLAFLARDPDPCLWFFGGEPLLRVDLIAEILARIISRHVVIQTNGLLCDRLNAEVLARTHVVSLSLDGPPDLNDRHRGPGVYAEVLRQAAGLRARGYTGRVDVRLTINPGTSIWTAVDHFWDGCAFPFDAIHWQLNALFHSPMWRESRRQITGWFARSYNPEISRLVTRWTDEMLDKRRLRQLVPFARVLHTLLTGEEITNVRCEAGRFAWTITTDGALFPCPVLRSIPAYRAGHLEDADPAALSSPFGLGPPCTECEVRTICGGRCLCANRENEWDAQGFDLVCGSVKHLITALGQAARRLEPLFASGELDLADLERVQDYEVIP